MAQIKGPAIFLAQFMGDEEPFNSLPSITAWAKSLGYIGTQLPAWPFLCVYMLTDDAVDGPLAVWLFAFSCASYTSVSRPHR